MKNKPGTQDYTRVYTYRTLGKVRRLFTPIRTLFAHYSHSRRIVFTTILTLFPHYLHGRTLFARSHTIRTPFARSHTIRTVAHYIRTLFAHYSRHRHPTFAHYSHQFTHTPVTLIACVGASPFALIHAVFTQFTPVRICECAICTLYSLVLSPVCVDSYLLQAIVSGRAGAGR